MIALANAVFAFRADSRSWALVLGDWAVSFGVLAGVYFFRPDLKWVKQAAGRVSPVGVFLFWPYFLLARVVLFLRTRIETRSPFTEIAPGLFLGRRPFGFDQETLETLNIGAVLDLTWEFGANQRVLAGRPFLSLPVLDGTAPTVQQLGEALTWLDDQDGRIVLVHCALGNSRSASIVCAFLLARGLAGTPEEAIQLVRAKRPSVELNREQLAAVTEFTPQNHI